VKASILRDHSFGFGEEACEICGTPFVETRDDAAMCCSTPSTARNASRHLDRAHSGKTRQSIRESFAHFVRQLIL
jgi:hypothetical protein